ncbi:MAG: A/G-specific adenine glycosylase [Nitrospinae bacterium]|nr:A/G-specific adenine glycosylase [Nitrospinota bacterium]
MSNKTKNNPDSLRLTPPERRRFRRRILSWYEREKRELPWRGEQDPYRVWVSEAMLQQTRAGTVRLRYTAFIERFPTLAALADAPLDAVLAEWQGLGYYGRARNLHRAARQVMNQEGSAMPKTRDALLALPGVGPYMAGAVASIAFGVRCAAIDGNVLRVMSRILNLSLPVDTPPAQKTIHEETQALVPRARPGDFNQALMDLGASICLPRNPDCAQCPVRVLCAGHLAGTQNALPVKTAKKPPEPCTLFQFRAERNGLVLLTQREKTGLFGGMWELPGFMVEGHKEKAAPRWLREQCALLLGPGWRPGRELARITRTLTHRKILFVVHLAEHFMNDAPQADRNGLLWASEEDFRSLAVSTAQRAAWSAAKSALHNMEGTQGER